MKMTTIWKIRADMRNQEYEFPDWVQKTSYRCYNPPDRDSYLPYREWEIESPTKFSSVPVSDADFPHLLSSLSFLSSALPSPKNTKLCHPSPSLHAEIMSDHQVLHTASIASSQVWMSLPPSHILISWRMLYSTLYIPHSHNHELTINWSFSSHHASLLIYRLQVLLQSWSIMASKCISQHALLWPPSASLSSLDLSLQEHLQTRSITASRCISEFTWLWPPGASWIWLDHGIQVHLQTRWIMASMCISGITRSQPPSASRSWLDRGLQVRLQTRLWSPNASLSSLDLGHQVHLITRAIMASKFIFHEEWEVYGNTAVTAVDWVTGSIYSGDPGVDRHHLIFTSSHHTSKIHTVSFPTFGLTCCFRDFVDPHGRVVSYLLTLFLRSRTAFAHKFWLDVTRDAAECW